uniref:Protein SPT2 homolog n=1 Tax=Heterorhabditis bacteriophora TaxID=37862 RepID=A0A1I7W675_HETBA
MRQSCGYSSAIKKPDGNDSNSLRQLNRISSKSDKSTDMKSTNSIKYSNDQLKKSSTSIISTAAAEKKYLPGDIRSKQNIMATKHTDTNVASSSSRSNDSVRTISQSLKKSQKPPANYINRPRQMEHLQQTASTDKNRHRLKKHERLRNEQKSSRSNRAYDYDDVEDEDEYDSDMDDFIDDTGLDMDELSRQEFEETLKMMHKELYFHVLVELY